MNLRQFTRLFVFAAITAAGCVSEQETVREVPYVVDREVPVYVDRPVDRDEFQGLEIIPGDLSDVAIMNGEDRELLRFTVVNHGERDVTVREIVAHFHTLHVAEGSEPARFTDVKLQDRAAIVTLTGPVDVDLADESAAVFTDSFPLRAGERLTLVLRADVEAAGLYRITVGSGIITLLEDVVYTDTGERVPSSMIRDNRTIGRVFEVLTPPADMPAPSPDGPVALVASFGGIEGIITPSPFPYYLGTATVTAYGGDAVGGNVRITGNIGAFHHLELVEADMGVVVATGDVFDGTTADLDLSSITFDEGELRTFQVQGVLRPADDLGPYYATDIGFLLDHLSFTSGEGMSGGAFIRTFADPRVRIFRAYPNIVAQTLPTTTLAGGTMDLYTFQVSVNPSGTPIYLGGMTLNLSVEGSTRLTLSQLRVRRGSSELPRDSYRVVDITSGADLEDGTVAWGSFGSTVVGILFDVAPLEIGATGGDVLTVQAQVDDVQPEQGLWVGFGPRAFSGVQGLIDSNGFILWNEGMFALRSQDALYWSDDPAPSYYYTGSWMIGGLDTLVRFTR